jgi:hypothetical protein
MTITANEAAMAEAVRTNGASSPILALFELLGLDATTESADSSAASTSLHTKTRKGGCLENAGSGCDPRIPALPIAARLACCTHVFVRNPIGEYTCLFSICPYIKFLFEIKCRGFQF